MLQVFAPETYRKPVVWLIQRVWLFVRPVKRVSAVKGLGGGHAAQFVQVEDLDAVGDRVLADVGAIPVGADVAL